MLSKSTKMVDYYAGQLSKYHRLLPYQFLFLYYPPLSQDFFERYHKPGKPIEIGIINAIMASKAFKNRAVYKVYSDCILISKYIYLGKLP